MRRRNFITALGALCAVPMALTRIAKAKPKPPPVNIPPDAKFGVFYSTQDGRNHYAEFYLSRWSEQRLPDKADNVYYRAFV